jgi:hypothetical protein
MKTVIITVPPMKPPERIRALHYSVDGNKAIEYEKPVKYPVNGVLARTMEKDEDVKVIFIMVTGEKSKCEANKKVFIEEFEEINRKIGAKLSEDTVEIDYNPTKQTYNKLITDLAKKIPENAEIFVDNTYGSKPESISLFCALRFVEEFCDAVVQYIIYGKVEFDNDDPINPMIYDLTSLYYLFKLMGTMGADNAETALKKLNDFFSL